jgi:putative pyruvate formate lyase activating enzyme
MGAPKYLKRYFKVQKDEMPALFKITERVPAEFDPGMQLEELRKIHEKEIEEYRKLRENLEIEAAEALAYKDTADRLTFFPSSTLRLKSWTGCWRNATAADGAVRLTGKQVKKVSAG